MGMSTSRKWSRTRWRGRVEREREREEGKKKKQEYLVCSYVGTSRKKKVIVAPMRGIEPRPRRWERRILTTRPHGNTHSKAFSLRLMFTWTTSEMVCCWVWWRENSGLSLSHWLMRYSCESYQFWKKKRCVRERGETLNICLTRTKLLKPSVTSFPDKWDRLLSTNLQ